MDLLIFVGLVGCFILAGYAWRRTFTLAGEIERLKRNEYYTDSKLKNVSKQISESVEPLRLQLAQVASGNNVDLDLIKNGRLYRNITAAEAEALLQQEERSPNPSFLVLDVRTAKEFAVKRLPAAKLLPIEELEWRYKQEVPEGINKVLVYCAGGERSRLACDFLSRQGYVNLYNLVEGLQRWQGPTIGEGGLQLIQIRSPERKNA